MGEILPFLSLSPPDSQLALLLSVGVGNPTHFLERDGDRGKAGALGSLMRPAGVHELPQLAPDFRPLPTTIRATYQLTAKEDGLLDTKAPSRSKCALPASAIVVEKLASPTEKKGAPTNACASLWSLSGTGHTEGHEGAGNRRRGLETRGGERRKGHMRDR